MAYVYQNGQWVHTSDGNGSTGKDNSSSKPTASQPTSTSGKSSKDKDSVGKKEKSVLQGDVEVKIPQPVVTANNNITLNGLGTHLSGLYFIEEVKNRFGSNGYSQTVSVSRDGVGEVVRKGGSEIAYKDEKKKEEERRKKIKK